MPNKDSNHESFLQCPSGSQRLIFHTLSGRVCCRDSPGRATNASAALFPAEGILPRDKNLFELQVGGTVLKPAKDRVKGYYQHKFKPININSLTIGSERDLNGLSGVPWQVKLKVLGESQLEVVQYGDCPGHYTQGKKHGLLTFPVQISGKAPSTQNLRSPSNTLGVCYAASPCGRVPWYPNRVRRIPMKKFILNYVKTSK